MHSMLAADDDNDDDDNDVVGDPVTVRWQLGHKLSDCVPGE